MSSTAAEFKPTMNEIVVAKSDLLERLEKNRKGHRKAFEKALEGYKEAAIEALEEALADARKGKVRLNFHALVMPQDHTADYDRAIEKMKMSQHEQVHLTDQEFAQYVMDDWAWKQQFTQTSALYTK